MARAALAELKQAADKLFQHNLLTGNVDPETKEALRYRTALFQGCKTLSERPLTTNVAETICSPIKNKDMTVRKIPGTKLTNDKTGEAIYTSPKVGNSICGSGVKSSNSIGTSNLIQNIN